MTKKKTEPRKSEMSSVGQAMDDLFTNYKLKGKFDQNRLIASWEKLMGEMIAQRTGKLFFKNNTLYVEILSAPLKHELKLAKSKIIENFDKDIAVGVVEDIIFL